MCLGLSFGKFVVDFVDDLRVYSSDMENHESHLTTVFEMLREAQIYVNPEKTVDKNRLLRACCVCRGNQDGSQAGSSYSELGSTLE